MVGHAKNVPGENCTARYNFCNQNRTILVAKSVPVSQENLSPGNCVAATVFPQEIMQLTINVATVYPKEILSSGNTVARHGSVDIDQSQFLCCN